MCNTNGITKSTKNFELLRGKVFLKKREDLVSSSSFHLISSRVFYQIITNFYILFIKKYIFEKVFHCQIQTKVSTNGLFQTREQKKKRRKMVLLQGVSVLSIRLQTFYSEVNLQQNIFERKKDSLFKLGS